jgi:hypothetical protein
VNLLTDMFENVRLSTWVVGGILIILSIAMIALMTQPAARRNTASRLTSTIDLSLDENSRRSIEAAQSRRIVGAAIGGAVGAVVATWFVYLIGADREEPASLFLVGAYAVGASLGRAAASAAREATNLTGTVHLANARHRVLGDYIPRWERIVARTMVALSVIAVAFETSIPLLAPKSVDLVFPKSLSVAALVTVLAIVALFGFEAGGRLILRAHQNQGSPARLALDDVLRSAAIRDLAAAAFLLGTFGTFFGIQEIAMAFRPLDPPFIATAGGFNLLGGITVAAAAIEMLLSHSRRYMLRRRYPELVNVGPR